MRTDNSTANDILNGTLQQKQSKSINMRFYWLLDPVSQKMFKVCWTPGNVNLANYFTKHRPAKHVKHLRPLHTTQDNSPRDMQGCVELLAAPAAQWQPQHLLWPKASWNHVSPKDIRHVCCLTHTFSVPWR